MVLCVRAWDADVLLYEDRDFCNLYSTNYFENVSWCLSRHLIQCVQSLKRREESGKLNHWEFSKITANLILTIWLFCVYGPKTPRPQPNKQSVHDTWTWPTCNLIWTCALPTCCHIPIISRSFENKKNDDFQTCFIKETKKQHLLQLPHFLVCEIT